MNVLVVGYYTENYAQEATRLRCSLEELAVPHHLVPVTITGANPWKAAVMHKPSFLLSELLALDGKFDGLFYTDADSVLRRPPPWDDFKGMDFGYVKFRWSSSHPWETLTGGLYVSREAHMALFLRDWANATAKYAHTDTPEQHSLSETLRAWDMKLAAHAVSSEWVSIFDATHDSQHRPIFTHLQASRTKRR